MLKFCGVNGLLKYNKELDLDEFNKNPIQFLKKSLCFIDRQEEYKVLYRVIATCRDELNGNLISTLGYPITVNRKFYMTPSGYPRNFKK